MDPIQSIKKSMKKTMIDYIPALYDIVECSKLDKASKKLEKMKENRKINAGKLMDRFLLLKAKEWKYVSDPAHNIERMNLQIMSNQIGKFIQLSHLDEKYGKKSKEIYYYDIVNDLVVKDMNCQNKETCMYKEIFINHKYLPLKWKKLRDIYFTEIDSIKESAKQFEFI